MPERTLKVGEIAKHLAVDPNTVRNWCKWYAPHLSAGANPSRGQVRAFTLRDQNVLTFIHAALKEGMNHAELSEELARKTFSSADVDIIVGLAEVVPPSPQHAQEARSEAALLPVTLSGFRAEIDALRAEIQDVKHNQRHLIDDAFQRGRNRGLVLAGAIFGMMIWLIALLSYSPWWWWPW